MKNPKGIRKKDKVPFYLSKNEDNEFFWYVSIRMKVISKGITR